MFQRCVETTLDKDNTCFVFRVSPVDWNVGQSLSGRCHGTRGLPSFLFLEKTDL